MEFSDDEWKFPQTCFGIDLEFSTAALIGDTVQRVEESLVLILVSGGQGQEVRARIEVLRQRHLVTVLVELRPIVVAVQHPDVHLLGDNWNIKADENTFL